MDACVFPRSLPRPPLRLIAASCVLAAAPALSETLPSGGDYVLTKQVLAGGGGHASGGSYALVVTVGQSVAGQTDAEPYIKQQGFHAGLAPRPDSLFTDSFEITP